MHAPGVMSMLNAIDANAPDMSFIAGMSQNGRTSLP